MVCAWLGPLVGHEGMVINRKLMVGHQKIWSASECTFQSVCHAVNVVQVYGSREERVNICLTPKDGTNKYHTESHEHKLSWQAC